MNRHTDGEYILDLCRGYWAARTLFWGVEKGVFTLLEQGERGAREIAGILRTEPGATERVLNALVALGLLTKNSNSFRNSYVSDMHLVRGRRLYLGNTVLHARNLWDGWSRLGEAVQSGVGVAFDTVEKSPYEDRLRDFLLAMRDNAGLVAEGVVDALRWGNIEKMLDLGGGPGTFAEALLRRYPALQVTLYDLEPSVSLAKEILRGSAVLERIEFQAGNFITDDLGVGRYDAVLLANVVHMYDVSTNLMLAKKSHRVLKPGGQLAIYDYFLEEDFPAPEAALFDLNMLVGTVNGKNYPAQAMVAWLAEAGFSVIRQVKLTPYCGLVVGCKPEQGAEDF